MRSLVALLRPKQYVKNVFVFAPLFFSFSYDNLEKVLLSVGVFVLFSITASAIYILNDINDIEEDRQHPEKKFRPLAAGDISKGKAIALMIMLFGVAFICSYLLNVYLLLVLLIYVVNNVAYSLGMKHISILDIVMIAFGFLLRVIAGGVVTGIEISMWLITMTFLLAIFLGIAKRREDVKLLEQGLTTRKNVAGYNLEFINGSMVLMAGVIIVSYILYAVSAEVQQKFHTHNLYLTSFFVVIGILRYMQITFVEENSGNPSNIIFKDRFIQVVVLFWILSFAVIVKVS